MARLQLKPKHKITIGVLVIFVGICVIASTYFNEKKFQVFDDMNEQWYEQLVLMEDELEEILEEEPPIQRLEPGDPPGNTTTTRRTTTRPTQPAIDDSRFYVGYLTIPKINFRKGFTEIDHRFNTVSRNIQVIRPSDYPDVVGGNFIIAAHSGNSAISFFRDLWRLSVGDHALVSYQGREYRYVIRQIYYVPKTGQIPIRRDLNKTTLTLITCTRGDNTKQTVYIAELV
jgi:LPXTG-site transpeptidase (sortase) family protein